MHLNLALRFFRHKPDNSLQFGRFMIVCVWHRDGIHCPRHLRKRQCGILKERGLDMVVINPGGTFGPALQASETGSNRYILNILNGEYLQILTA